MTLDCGQHGHRDEHEIRARPNTGDAGEQPGERGHVQGAAECSQLNGLLRVLDSGCRGNRQRRKGLDGADGADDGQRQERPFLARTGPEHERREGREGRRIHTETLA